MSKKELPEETKVVRYAVLVEAALQNAPRNPQEMQLAMANRLPKKNGGVGNNIEKADAFTLLVETLDDAKLFITKEEAVAFADYLKFASNDARTKGRSINVFEVQTTLVTKPVHIVRNIFIPAEATKKEVKEKSKLSAKQKKAQILKKVEETDKKLAIAKAKEVKGDN